MNSLAVMMRTEHLAKSFSLGLFHKRIQAITDINLEVKSQEIFGLLGPNGAGKTTTLKILLGLVRPSSGKAEVLGCPIGDISAKKRLGYLTESPYFYDYLTGREMLIFMAKLFGLGKAQTRQRVGELLELVDMTRAADMAMRRYSKGMLQRIGLAQALINDPELVILDEPLTGLDPLGRKDLRELIANLRQRGKTVVFSSHILSDVEMLADRVAIIVRGKTVNTGRLDELLDARIISTEIIFSEARADLTAALTGRGLTIESSGKLLKLTLEGDKQIDEHLDLLRQHGAHVHTVTPRKESLEDVVVKQAQAGN